MECLITFEVIVEAEDQLAAERKAELLDFLKDGTNQRIESVRALWARDVTPLEDQIPYWIEQLQSRGYIVKQVPAKLKRGKDANTEADTNEGPVGTGDSDLPEDQTARLQQGIASDGDRTEPGSN